MNVHALITATCSSHAKRLTVSRCANGGSTALAETATSEIDRLVRSRRGINARPLIAFVMPIINNASFETARLTDELNTLTMIIGLR